MGAESILSALLGQRTHMHLIALGARDRKTCEIDVVVSANTDRMDHKSMLGAAALVKNCQNSPQPPNRKNPHGRTENSNGLILFSRSIHENGFCRITGIMHGTMLLVKGAGVNKKNW